MSTETNHYAVWSLASGGGCAYYLGTSEEEYETFCENTDEMFKTYTCNRFKTFAEARAWLFQDIIASSNQVQATAKEVNALTEEVSTLPAASKEEDEIEMDAHEEDDSEMDAHIEGRCNPEECSWDHSAKGMADLAASRGEAATETVEHNRTEEKKTVFVEPEGTDEKSANRLFDVWVETTTANEKVDVKEVYNRIGTLFCVTSKELEMSFEEAQSILFAYMKRYAEDLGMATSNNTTETEDV
jgi:hypothetical protein